MRCKKHLSDVSSTIGVCGSCLRERLFSLIEAQTQLTSISDYPNPNPNPNYSHHQHQPQPLIFPRSVSPYISRRKSDQPTTTSTKSTIQRFYSTPQVGPTFQKKKKSAGKFNLITKLFRSKSSVSSTANSEVGPAELSRWRNRGMSPQNEWDDLEEINNDSPMARGRPSPGRVRPSPARIANNVASFAFCLSPLVRASPASRYHWGAEPGFSGEIRVPATGKNTNGGGGCNGVNNKPHLSEAASFCANRSRKLADFGRLNRNR